MRASPSRPPCRAARAGSEGAGRGQVLTRRPLDEIRHHAAAADGELDAHWKGLAATAARGAGALAGACLSAAPLCDALNALGSALEAELKALRLDEGALGEHPLFCDAEVASPPRHLMLTLRTPMPYRHGARGAGGVPAVDPGGGRAAVVSGRQRRPHTPLPRHPLHARRPPRRRGKPPPRPASPHPAARPTAPAINHEIHVFVSRARSLAAVAR